MAVSHLGRLGILAATVLALTGCDESATGGIFGSSAKPQAAAPEATARAGGGARVVEAPDVFDVTDTALWDGRPSLGLIWVAYENAQATNVIMRNEENGKTVVGALYRRERFFPGPPFQLSSDAAAELGILAGSPTKIRVTALKEEAEPEAPAPTPAETADSTDTESSADNVVAEVPLPAAGKVSAVVDPIEAAAAAIEAADPSSAKPEVDSAPILAAPPRRPTTEGPNAPIARRMEVPEPPSAPTAAAPADIAVLAPTVEPISEPIPEPAASVSSLSKPFIQVGIFSVRENADQTAKSLSDAGIIPIVSEQTVGGRTFFRVVVGPARNVLERSTLLKQVKDQGFADAYFVRN